MPKNTPIRIIDSQKTRAATFLGGGASSGGVVDHGTLGGLLDNDHPQYVLTTTEIGAGEGLTGGGAIGTGVSLALASTVAGDGLTYTTGVVAVGAGLGISVGVNDVALASSVAGNGLTYSSGVLAVGVANTGATGLTVEADTVRLTSSSDVSAGTSAILASNAGALTVASLYATTRLSSSLIDTTISNIKIAPALDLILDPVGNDVLPETNYDINLGALSKKYLTLHAAELWVETLVAQNTIATIGGRILVGPTTTLTRDLAAAATTIYVKHNEMASGDRTYMEANGKVEFFAITSGATSTGTDYSYTVTRNLDGTGANDWYAGDAMFNTGTTGEGFIDLYSLHGVKAGTEYGPTIVGNIRLSSTYNDWEERWAIGNLNGLYDYGTTVYGFAAGDPDAANVTVDATNGVRMRQGTTNTIVLAPNGASYFAGVMTIDTNGEIRQGTGTLGSNYTGLRIWRDSSIGRIGGYASNVLQWYGDTAGNLVAGAGYVTLNASGIDVAGYHDSRTSTPEPGYSDPISNPSAALTYHASDQGEAWYSAVDGWKTYVGGTALRLFGSSRHAVDSGQPATSWTHYVDAVLEMPGVTKPASTGSWFERLWLKAPSTAFALFNGLAQLNGNTMWHAGNDGSGSTLDADTLDTYHASSFALLSGAQFTGIVYGMVSASGTGGSPLRFTTTGALATSTNNDQLVFYHIADNEFGITFGDSTASRTLHLQPSGGAVHIGGGASTVFRVGNTSDLYSAKIQTNGNIHAQGAVTSELYLQMATASTPAAATGFVRLWFDGTNIKVILPGGTTKTLSWT